LVIFYGKELLAPRPTPKLEGHPLSAVRDFLLNVFAATLHILRPLLHPQPEDAPCLGDRDPLIMDSLETSFIWVGGEAFLNTLFINANLVVNVGVFLLSDTIRNIAKLKGSQ
jgi:hypothetical protein